MFFNFHKFLNYIKYISCILSKKKYILRQWKLRQWSSKYLYRNSSMPDENDFLDNIEILNFIASTESTKALQTVTSMTGTLVPDTPLVTTLHYYPHAPALVQISQAEPTHCRSQVSTVLFIFPFYSQLSICRYYPISFFSIVSLFLFSLSMFVDHTSNWA